VENATGDRDKVLAAVANAKNQLTDLQQQSDAAAKSLTALQQQGADAAKTLGDLQAKMQAARPRLTPPAPSEVPLAASMPTTNLDKICQSAKVGALPEDQASAFQACVRDEQAARDQLRQKWGRFSATARGNCAETPGIAFSYTELLTCLEMQMGNDFDKPQTSPVIPTPAN
jgi:hypothetical protein